MRILIKGAYGTYNFGDDLLMYCIYHELADSNIAMDFSCPDHKYIKDMLIGICINANYTDKKYSFEVYGGGTQFYFFGKIKFNIKLKLKKVIGNFISFKRLQNTVTRFMKRNVKLIDENRKIYLGIGIGPFFNSVEKNKCISTISKSSFIAVRDIYSYNLLKDSEKVILGADLCFSSKFISLVKKLKKPKKIYDVAFILRDWDKTKDGIVPEKNITKIIEKLNRSKKIYRFIFFSKFHDMNWINFCKKNQFEYLIWNPDKMNISDFLIEISKSKTIFSSRYHGLVISSLLSIPFVGLKIEPKISLFTDKFNQQNCVGYPFDCDVIYQLIDDIRWEDKYEKIVNLENKRADFMLNKFKDFLIN